MQRPLKITNARPGDGMATLVRQLSDTAQNIADLKGKLEDAKKYPNTYADHVVESYVSQLKKYEAHEKELRRMQKEARSGGNY